MNKEAVVELTKAAQRDVKGFKKAAPQILDHLKILKTHPERGHLLSLRAAKLPSALRVFFASTFWFFPKLIDFR
jgi:membrane protein required for beta-lactamase induction